MSGIWCTIWVTFWSHAQLIVWMIYVKMHIKNTAIGNGKFQSMVTSIYLFYKLSYKIADADRNQWNQRFSKWSLCVCTCFYVIKFVVVVRYFLVLFKCSNYKDMIPKWCKAKNVVCFKLRNRKLLSTKFRSFSSFFLVAIKQFNTYSLSDDWYANLILILSIVRRSLGYILFAHWNCRKTFVPCLVLSFLSF